MFSGDYRGLYPAEQAMEVWVPSVLHTVPQLQSIRQMCGAIVDVTMPVFSIFGKFSKVYMVLENCLLNPS